MVKVGQVYTYGNSRETKPTLSITEVTSETVMYKTDRWLTENLEVSYKVLQQLLEEGWWQLVKPATKLLSLRRTRDV